MERPAARAKIIGATTYNATADHFEVFISFCSASHNNPFRGQHENNDARFGLALLGGGAKSQKPRYFLQAIE